MMKMLTTHESRREFLEGGKALGYLLILSALAGFLYADVHTQWKLFVSRSQHFSVRYPSAWNQLQDRDVTLDRDTLEIINFPNSEIVSGVIIRKGGASIGVNAAPVNAAPGNVQSLEDLVRRYKMDDAVLADHAIPLTRAIPDGCQTLRRVVTRDEVGPHTFSIDTDYFCSTRIGLFVVLLTNWEGDPHQSMVQDTALKIALSLRVR